MNILLTGGAGYIGSHAAVVLHKAGYRVVLYDNLCNSSISIGNRLKQITGQHLPLVEGDVRDTALLTQTLRMYKIDSVIHFAGLKAVGKSVDEPVEYYDNNIGGTLSLLQAMQGANIKTLVFSSSATVYGTPKYLPIDEDHPTSPTNPYGRSKLYIEEILTDMAQSDSTWRIVCLRYFNPVGAHDSGLIGEYPNNIPNNLMPYIAQVATGKLPHLNIFGNDYPTPDGTGVRDYIHIMDLVEGHLAALTLLKNLKTATRQLQTYNLGTGTGYSVLEIVNAFEDTSGRSIPYQIAPRRSGDIAACYANADKARFQLRWKASRTLRDMCASMWHFQHSITLQSDAAKHESSALQVIQQEPITGYAPPFGR